MTRTFVEAKIEFQLTLAENGDNNGHVYAYWMWQEGRLPVTS